MTLPEVIAAVLVDHLDRFTGPESSALVFTSPEGEPLRRNNFCRRVWYPAVKEVGLGGLRFHDLRHKGATLAAATGAPLRAIMARLGHATPAAALRYQHVIAGQDADIAANLNRIARRALGASPPMRRSTIGMPRVPWRAMSTHGDQSAQEPEHLELPVEELLRRGRPLPPHEDMLFDGIDEEEGRAFLAAIAE